MNHHPAVLARHDCERLPDRAWLAQLTTDIRALDAQEGLLLPLPVDKLASDSSAPATGVGWLTHIALRTLPPVAAAVAAAAEPAASGEGAPAPPPELLRARQHAREGDLGAALAAYASFLPASAGLAAGAEDLLALARVQPRDANVQQLLGDLQQALGHWEEACASYQRALTLLARESAHPCESGTAEAQLRTQELASE